jgi:hypothetical protein
MPIRDNTNRGVLFRNDNKTDDKHADYNGHMNVDGIEYWLNAWINESKNGNKYMSLSIKPKNAAVAKVATPASRAPFNDEIPFAPEWR